jgi:hypothetical protein
MGEEEGGRDRRREKIDEYTFQGVNPTNKELARVLFLAYAPILLSSLRTSFK